MCTGWCDPATSWLWGSERGGREGFIEGVVSYKRISLSVGGVVAFDGVNGDEVNLELNGA
jgi:hypothetical protein